MFSGMKEFVMIDIDALDEVMTKKGLKTMMVDMPKSLMPQFSSLPISGLVGSGKVCTGYGVRRVVKNGHSGWRWLRRRGQQCLE
jgi:hypothetical protein